MKFIYIAIIAVIIILFIFFVCKKKTEVTTEHFNDQTGRFCSSCENLPFGQCTRCFNCGYCTDLYGNGKCIPGDYKGPYNAERCNNWLKEESGALCTNNSTESCKASYEMIENNVNPSKDTDYYLWKGNKKTDMEKNGTGSCFRWYHNDPFSYMLQRGEDTGCAKPKYTRSSNQLVNI